MDMTTGSLGQGASTAAGIALALKKSGKPQYTYLILGDGECQEGQVWEAVEFAAAQKLERLIAFVDNNGKQVDGPLQMAMGDVPGFGERFRAFGWRTIEVEDGNDVRQIWEAIDAAKNGAENKPTVIVLHTVKGKGWSYTEGMENCHSISVSSEQAAEAAKEFAMQGGVQR